MCRKGAWAELTVCVPSMGELPKQGARTNKSGIVGDCRRRSLFYVFFVWGIAANRRLSPCIETSGSYCARSEPVVSESCSLKSREVSIHGESRRFAAIPIYVLLFLIFSLEACPEVMFFVKQNIVTDLMIIKAFFYVCILFGILMPYSLCIPPSFAGDGRDGFL